MNILLQLPDDNVFSHLRPFSCCSLKLECPLFSFVSFMKSFLTGTVFSPCLINQWIHSAHVSWMLLVWKTRLGSCDKAIMRTELICYHRDGIFCLFNPVWLWLFCPYSKCFYSLPFSIIFILNQIYREVKYYKWFPYILYPETVFFLSASRIQFRTLPYTLAVIFFKSPILEWFFSFSLTFHNLDEFSRL